MNTLELKVVLFGNEDVIATSLFRGRYFSTNLEYAQFDPAANEYLSSDYVAFYGNGYGNDPDAIVPYDQSNEPFSLRYAWYDTATSQWHTNNKFPSYYWNSTTSTFNFPTGTN